MNQDRLHLRALIVLCLMGCASEAPAAAAPLADGASKPALAGLDRVPADAAAFVTVRPADLWNSDGLKKLGNKLQLDVFEEILETGLKPDEIERLTWFVIETKTDGLKGSVLVATVKPVDRAKLHKSMEAGPEIRRRDLSLHSLGQGNVIHHLNDRLFAFGQEAAVVGLATGTPRGDGRLAGAIQLAADGHQVAGAANLVVLKDVLQDLRRNQQNRDPLSMLGAYDMLLDLRQLAFHGDLKKGLQLEVSARVNDEKQAREFEKMLDGGLAWLKYRLPRLASDPEQAPPPGRRRQRARPEPGKLDRPFVDLAALVLDKTSIRRDGDSLTSTIRLEAPEKTAEFLALVVNHLEEVQQRQRTINVRMLLLALHNYASTYQDQLPPPAVLDKNGKPLLSWRVLLLPYVEQDNLYRQFKLDEPWDSEHNKKLLPLMPKVYAVPGARNTKPGITHYRTIGKFGVLSGKFKAGAAHNWQNDYTIANIPDGTSNTVFVVEAEEGVPWSKPDELDFDPMNAKSPLPKLGKTRKDVFLVGMMDGSARWISKKVSEQTLRSAFAPNDGNVLGSDW